MANANFASQLGRVQPNPFQGLRRGSGAIALVLTLEIPLSLSPAAQAQSIIPARDGTGTQVQLQGNELSIRGGSLSGDGTNLFHSFDRFNVATDEIATFRTSPTIQNIIGRVLGGEASRIDGLLQVTNDSSHLLLINPAGIVSGLNAQILVPGGFTATTADRIGFGDAWLTSTATAADSDGSSNGSSKLLSLTSYADFQGAPTAFDMAKAAQGVVLNEGYIVVGQGKAIRLVGSQVINTGQLRAPGGEVTLLGLGGGQTARFNAGTIELAPNGQAKESSTALTVSQLIGGEATRLKQKNGQVHLVGRALPSHGAFTAGQLNVTGDPGGRVRILGDRVALLGADITANGSGRVNIGGAFRGGNALPAATTTLVDVTTTINANGVGAGDGGQVVVWANGNTGFWGAASAQGGAAGGNGGQLEISGLQNLRFEGSATVASAKGIPGSILLDPRNIVIQNSTSSPNDNQLLADQLSGDPAGQILAAQDSDDTFFISRQSLEALSGNIRLEASENIQVDSSIGEIEIPNAEQITFVAGGAFITDPGTAIRNFDSTIPSREGSLTIQAGEITAGSFNMGNADVTPVSATAGDVTLIATGDINVQQVVGQTITLNSTNGNISLSVGNGDESSRAVRAQTVNLIAPQGNVLLDGGIQAGEVLRPQPARINIEAQQFQAINPFPTAALADPSQTPVPMSLWAFPANVPDNANITAPPNLPLEGAIDVSLADGISNRLGSGETLISISLQADSFTIADGLALGNNSGTLGGIGLGLSSIPPNVNPLALNNEFTSLELPTDTVAELLLDDSATIASATCPTLDEQDSKAPVLQAVVPPESPTEITPEDLGLTPSESVTEAKDDEALRAVQGEDNDAIACGRE